MGGGTVLSGSYNDTTLHNNAMDSDNGLPLNSPMRQSMWINLHGRGLWVSTGETKPALDFQHHADTDAYRTSYAIHWIETHLSSMPYLLSLHFINTWIPYTSENGLPMIQFPNRLSSQIVWDMIWYVYPLILLMAVLGLVVTWRRWKQELIIMYLIILTTLVVNIVMYGSSRFRAPIEPFLVLCTCGALWWLFSSHPGTLRYRRNQKIKKQIKAHVPQFSSEKNSQSSDREFSSTRVDA
jgi:hypothetical protein